MSYAADLEILDAFHAKAYEGPVAEDETAQAHAAWWRITDAIEAGEQEIGVGVYALLHYSLKYLPQTRD